MTKTAARAVADGGVGGGEWIGCLTPDPSPEIVLRLRYASLTPCPQSGGALGGMRFLKRGVAAPLLQTTYPKRNATRPQESRRERGPGGEALV